jgi:hypothetical protein
MTASADTPATVDSPPDVGWRPGVRELGGWLTASRWRLALAWALGFAVTFALNVRLSGTTAANSDGASQALQAWDMLHGNIAQHGWMTGDVAYYPNDVLEYALIELVRGLSAADVHWYGALTYTLAMLLAALVAMGKPGEATGRQRLARGAIAAGIMIAPELDAGVYSLLQGPAHLGAAIPVLLAWLILDRARQRWYVPVAVGLLLAITGISDLTTLITGVLPLAVVCAYRVLRARAFAGQPLAAQRHEMALIAASLAAGAITLEGARILTALGALTEVAPITKLAPAHLIFWHNFRVAGLCLLVLAGANFIGVHSPARAGIEMLHLAGAALGAGGILLAAWRFLRDEDLISQLLLAAVALNLAAFVAGTHAEEITFTHEMSAVLPFGAALAGRLLAQRLLAWRLSPVLALALCGYLAGFGYEAAQPQVPAQNQALIPWLKAHHLTYGLSGYWAANSVTLASGGQVRILALNRLDGKVLPATQLAKREWIDPKTATANFVVLFPTYAGRAPFTGFTGIVGFSFRKDVLATFGPPDQTYHYRQYTILVWNNKNLLADMAVPLINATDGPQPAYTRPAAVSARDRGLARCVSHCAAGGASQSRRGRGPGSEARA